MKPKDYALTNRAKIVDLGLKIDEYLIIADLHLGYEESLNKDGLMIPKFQFDKILNRLESITDMSSANKIIINGDLKHEFGKISRQEWKEVHSFLEYLHDQFEEIILIKGNHDNFTPYITKKLDILMQESFSIDDFLILHGHQIPEDLMQKKEKKLVIGHEHPCIGLRSGERVEKIKCFLKGKFTRKELSKELQKELIVMPSFNFVTEGSDILHEKLLSPFLNRSSIDNFEVYGVEDFEVFDFGKIKDVIKLNQRFV